MSFSSFSSTRALSFLTLFTAVGVHCGAEPPLTSQTRVQQLVTFSAQQKILADDKASDSTFGSAVALSRDGNTALVGSPGRSDGALASNGAAYILTRSSGTWTQQEKLNALDLESQDMFGFSVALSRDGNTALIGANKKSDVPMSIFFHGAAYVFTRSGSSWTQQQKLTAMDLRSSDNFGYSVALSGDGNTAIISARDKSDSPNSFNGATYVFTRASGTWTQQQKLLVTDRLNGDRCGAGVALSEDASVAVIGCESKSDSPNSGNGAVYVFRNSSGSFSEAQKLNAVDRANNDRFGCSVSIAADGKTVLIGARSKRVSGLGSAGAAYIFSDTMGSFAQQAMLVTSDPAAFDLFGSTVSLSGSGNTALIGAYQKANPPVVSAGAAYLFTRSAGSFVPLMKLSANDPVTGDAYGQAVALSRDGGTVVVGTPSKADGSMNLVGAVYAYVGDGSVDGTSCTADSECASGSCSDGVCCDLNCSDTTDCRACVGAMTGVTTGTCARVGAAMNYACRPKDSAKPCDVAEVCNGLSDSCPTDIGTSNTSLLCRAVASGKACDTAEYCDGASPDCPTDGFRAAGTVCRLAIGPCDVTESCSGTSPDCPANKLANSSTMCKPAGTSSTCDPADYCDGVRALCPSRYAAAGMSCGSGLTCNGMGLCR